MNLGRLGFLGFIILLLLILLNLVLVILFVFVSWLVVRLLFFIVFGVGVGSVFGVGVGSGFGVVGIELFIFNIIGWLFCRRLIGLIILMFWFGVVLIKLGWGIFFKE